MSEINPIRRSPIAGSWYSSNPDKLRREVSGYIEQAEIPQMDAHIYGLISPHAGYFYSGSTAGYAYKCVEGMAYDLCMIASPMHAYLPYPLLTSAHTAYETPLGKAEIDHDLVSTINQQLVQSTLPGMQLVANDQEHSLEIQLPFLQIALAKPFQLLPIMVRTNDPQVIKPVARLVADQVRGMNVLVVASTDLSHFYNEKTANRFDDVMLKRMTDFSPDGVLEAESNEEGFACGAGAVALVLWITQFLGAKTVTLLHHSTSAKASGDTSSVVGYGALAITG